MIGYGSHPTLAARLQARGWHVVGIFVGGCVARGVGSSFLAAAHTHTAPDDPHRHWICVRSPRRVLTASGEPSRLLRHEAAHTFTRSGHGTPAFIRALALVGLQTDSYSRAGRSRRDARRTAIG